MIAALWGRAARYVLGAGAVLLAIVTFGWSQRRAGRAEERAAADRRTLQIKERQDEAAAGAPRGRDAVARRLRDGQF